MNDKPSYDARDARAARAARQDHGGAPAALPEVTAMLCPFCLAEVATFERLETGWRCPACAEPVPALYHAGYTSHPPSVFSTVGFSGHGKTVFLAALFHLLSHPRLAEHWPRYYRIALGDHSLERLAVGARALAAGTLPDSTPQLLPTPTMLRLAGLPIRDGVTLLCYDAAGESFKRAASLRRYARFLTRAQTVLFLVSVPDLLRQERDAPVGPGEAIKRLLEIYANGMAELGGDTRRQRLLLVFTKADEWEALQRPGQESLLAHVCADSFEGIGNYPLYVGRLREISLRLRELMAGELGGRGFLNHAAAHFASLDFCIVSALGSAPAEQAMQTRIAPRRVLDPLLWMLDPDLAGSPPPPPPRPPSALRLALRQRLPVGLRRWLRRYLDIRV